MLMVIKVWFSSNHSFTALGSLLNTCSILTTSLPETSSAESSAYNVNLHFTAAFMSLTYIKNRSSPSIELWGTPHIILHAWEYVPAISTICFLSLKYDTNQFIAIWFSQSALNLLIIILWFTVSKALWRSKTTEK